MPIIPVPKEMPEIVGLFVGGCVERGDGSSFRASGHAHMLPDDAYPGWVCIRSAKRVYTASGRPTTLMWHEYAHVLTGEGHTARWRATMVRLGRPAEAERYRRNRAVLTGIHAVEGSSEIVGDHVRMTMKATIEMVAEDDICKACGHPFGEIVETCTHRVMGVLG